MYEKILVPLDGSATAERALKEAAQLAGKLGSTLCLLHVLDDFPLYGEMAITPSFQQTLEVLRKYGDDLLLKASKQDFMAGLQVETVQREALGARVADVIVEQVISSKCQLIALGTHGRRGINRLLMGSDAELVLRQSPVPVLMVKGETGSN